MSDILRELARLTDSLERLSHHLAVDAHLANHDLKADLALWQRDAVKAARLMTGYGELLRLTVEALPVTESTGKRYTIPVHAIPRSCRACGARIFWGTSDKGRRIPLDGDGRNHLEWCHAVTQRRAG